MLDKRFWSAAVIVATIVIAGASALPALLLRPAPTEAPSASVTPAVAIAPPPADSGAAAVIVAAPPPAASEPVAPVPAPADVTVRTENEIAAQPETLKEPPPGVPVELQAAAEPKPAAASAARETIVLPPVQPLGVPAAQAAMEPAPTAVAAAPAESPATKKAIRQAHLAAARDTKQKRRAVRPAPYSIREFFAWRR